MPDSTNAADIVNNGVQPDTTLAGGTYDLIRQRLSRNAQALRTSIDNLNEARRQVFGTIATTLVGSERITTRQNCVPRDMVPIGHRFIFGYNTHVGLKSRTTLEDVFAIYEYRDRTFTETSLDLLNNDRFLRDLEELYKYYKNTTLIKLSSIGPHLYMVFRIGKGVWDIKAFKWLVSGDTLTYVDNRSDHEVVFPPQHEFEWTRTQREAHRTGVHPHISIEDKVFVETVGGDLTIKVEDNTDTGRGIYSEPVDDKEQSLDDAEIFYAIIGNTILLKIRPYREERYRYVAYNQKLQQAVRLDSIENACILLPDDQGLIFPNGYYLQNGDYKVFDARSSGMLFEQKIASPNGEDVQYVFYDRSDGLYQVLSYNLIAQKVETPVTCNGFSRFENGEFLLFKSELEPRNNHVIQIWQTPFTGPNFVAPTAGDSFLSKIGNKDVVRCIAACQSVLSLARKDEVYANLFIDITKEAEQILDSYFWIDKPEAFGLAQALREVKATAASAVEEYEKVVRIRRSTRETMERLREKTEAIVSKTRSQTYSGIHLYVETLAQLRALRGEVISLKELRYADTALIEALDSSVNDRADELSRACISFLLTPDGLSPYRASIQTLEGQIGQVEKSVDATALDDALDKVGKELELLIEVVSNLKITDPTQTAAIIENISSIFAEVNRVKSSLRSVLGRIRSREGSAEFSSQIKLFDQTITNYLDVADTPQGCDEYLSKLTVTLEELESRFAEFDDYLPLLSEKRTEVYHAFESRKLQLQEQRSKKCLALSQASERILSAIEKRLNSFSSVSEINGYFASDLMVDKVRSTVGQLQALADTTRADDLQTRLKSVKENAIRNLKDRNELFGDGNVIALGAHSFSINTQPLDITIATKNDRLYFHLIGTDFLEEIQSKELEATRQAWTQEVVSENEQVYRGEFLAYKLFVKALEGPDDSLDSLATMKEEELVRTVSAFMAPRYNEGYVKGIHDHDSAAILAALITLHRAIDLQIYTPSARALGRLFWVSPLDHDKKESIDIRLKAMHEAASTFGHAADLLPYRTELAFMIEGFAREFGRIDYDRADEAADYLCRERMRGDRFIISHGGDILYRAFIDSLREKRAQLRFSDALSRVGEPLNGRFDIGKSWLQAFLVNRPDTLGLADYVPEVAARIACSATEARDVVNSPTRTSLSGLRGTHPLLDNGSYHLEYTTFMRKLRAFEREDVPRFQRNGQIRQRLLEEFSQSLRLDEFKPKIMTSFVRNRLISDLYLPLIGANLAKQIGVAGENKRTDFNGMLLLISPPGYGKTTLIEYVANRLGLTLVKIQGPALGHLVTSLDPQDAPNASARKEIEKLNFALEMGNNVMIYVDDIQHCNPEFLQKFIALCDAQRSIEGVYKGVSKTYDLRGKRVAVVMAGNPYTESGEKFKIPDMLANRADTYNLGDMLGANEDAFKLSFLENAFTSNPILNELASRSQKDVYAIIRAAETGIRDTIELEGNYSAEAINEYLSLCEKLLRVRDIVLRVNMEYIRSAAQANEYRTEPPFKLQGSYRNMNRIAGKVLPSMNEEELFKVILTTYENEAQTLATGAESNLLKWKELNHCLSEQEQLRWEEIKKLFNQNKLAQADDRLGQAVILLAKFNESLREITKAIESRTAIRASPASRAVSDHVSVTHLGELRSEETTALAQTLEDHLTTIQAWVASMREDSSARSADFEELKTAVNRSMWLQRELISRFLKERRERKHASGRSTQSPEAQKKLPDAE